MTTRAHGITSPSNAGAGPVRIQQLELAARFSLRIADANAKAASGPLGLDLPEQIGERAANQEREALRLGPDEWIITAPEAERRGIVEALGAIYAETPHSLTDISDREFSILIEGPLAAELLSFGCPRDLDSLAPGKGVRTLFDGAQVVLWRDTADRFRMDVWRSFRPHVLELLTMGNAELAAT
jgi:sarcosine oxidase, subunit gamma